MLLALGGIFFVLFGLAMWARIREASASPLLAGLAIIATTLVALTTLASAGTYGVLGDIGSQPAVAPAALQAWHIMGSDGSLADSASTFLFLLAAAGAGLLAPRAVPAGWPGPPCCSPSCPWYQASLASWPRWPSTPGPRPPGSGCCSPVSPVRPSLMSLFRKRPAIRKHHKLLLAAAATTIATITGVTAASASPAAAPQAVSGTEYVQIMSTSAAGPASAIARGVFAAGGQARLGDAKVGTITFPGGTIVLSHRPGTTSSHFYRGGCLSLISQNGSYQIVRGTGRYAGISGHGTYQLSLEMIAARVHGGCSSAQPPVAQQELLRLAGPVRL
jgi:hypothetical protein